MPASVRPAHKDPDHIGPYRILERIGEGGMGIVYKAEQREPVRRIVALKVIKLGMDTKEVVARFEAERQALAMLSHPNVAKVFDGGMTETGRPYFAMEHVPGVPLTDYCNQNKLSTRQRLGLFIPVCNAIQHAHQKGIIHRDLKPSNILVQMFDGKPVPKVIDFGIAKATNQALTQHTLFTQTGAMVGTPEYMSPEQAMTSGLDVDTRTDIYSLGVILYELLTGTLPFDPKTLREAGLEGMARIIRESEPQKPSTRLTTLPGADKSDTALRHSVNPRLLSKEISGDLDWIILKAMEKDRTRRYETANGLAMDIQRHLTDEPVLARPPSTIYRFNKFVRKHKVGVVAGSVAALALLLAIVGTTAGWVWTRTALHRAETAETAADEERNRVKLARATAEKEAHRAVAANQFMRNMLSSAQPGAKEGGNQVKVVEVLDSAALALDRIKDQPELELDGRLTLASTFASLNLFKNAIDNYNRALAISRTLTGVESEQTLQITCDLLYTMGRSSNASGAEVLARQTLEAARRLFGDHHPLTRDALNSLGIVLHSTEQNEQAEEVFRGLTQESKAYNSVRDAKGTSRFYNNLALVVSAQGRTAEAERLQRQAVQLAKMEATPDFRRTGLTLQNLAMTLAEQNKLIEADTVFRESIEEYRKSLGETHPSTIRVIGSLLFLLEQKGDFAGALALRQELERLAKQTNAPTPPETQSRLDMTVAELLLRMGQEAQARELFHKAIQARHKLDQQEEGNFDFATGWWCQANLFLGLRIDREWSGPAIQAHAAHTAWNGLVNRADNDLSLDLVAWDKMRFKIEPWPPGPSVAEGGRNELWTVGDPKPGVYLFSISLPRRNSNPIREARWMFVAPWKLALHLTSDISAKNDAKWKALFESEPIERRTESILSFDQFGLLNRGFGPAHRQSGFALSATTMVKLPDGKYHQRLFADGSRRLLLNGGKLLDAWTSQDDFVEIIDNATSPPGELRVEWGLGTSRLIVSIEPIAPEADQMLAAARGSLADLEIAIDRHTKQITKGSATSAMYYDRGLLLGRTGRFKEAAEDFIKATELDPADHFRWYVRACTLAYLNDNERYRDTCKAMLQRFSDGGTAEVFDRMGKASLLLPPGYDDLPTSTKLVDRAVAAGGQYIHWFQMAKALAEYRAGKDHYEAALALIAIARPKYNPADPAAACCDLIGAMILFKTGQAAEATKLLQRAEQIIAKIGNTPGVHDFGQYGLENRLIYEILHREAEALIAGKGSK